MPTEGLRFLVVAYHYPPVGGGYTERIAGYVKYWTRLGCDIRVLTSVVDPSLPRDNSRLKQVRGTQDVIRVDDQEQGRVFHVLRRTRVATAIDKAIGYLSVPDKKVFWAKRATTIAERLIADHDIRLVLTTSAPYSTHIVGENLRLGNKMLRWVADFRDPMCTNFAIRHLHRAPLWHRLLRRRERRFYSVADKIVLNTPFNQQEIIDEFEVPREKTICFINGYDPEVLPEPSQGHLHGDTFRLMYVGGLRGDWFEGSFYHALANLRRRYPDRYAQMEIHFVGADSINSNLAVKLGVEDKITLHGFVSHGRLSQFYERATAFLLLLPPSDHPIGWVPQKLYSYMYCRKPIIALAPMGQAAELVRMTQSGVVIDPENHAVVADMLASMIGRLRGGDLSLARDEYAEGVVNEMAQPVLAREYMDSLAELVNTVPE